MDVFELCQGVEVTAEPQVSPSYSQEAQGQFTRFTGLLSAGQLAPLAEGVIKLLPGPVFFFLELPAEGDGDSYDTWYLDNCTTPVALAIMDRFGELLCQDGPSRFGFGSHKTGEELYLTEYQEFTLFTACPKEAEALLSSLGAKKQAKADSLWELLDQEHPGCLRTVELEGETVYDIPQLLENAGIYKAEKTE